MEDGYCNKCKGMKKVICGLLVLMNAFWWPMWTGLDGWIAFFGVVMVVTGVICTVKPYCGCLPQVCSTKKKR